MSRLFFFFFFHAVVVATSPEVMRWNLRGMFGSHKYLFATYFDNKLIDTEPFPHLRRSFWLYEEDGFYSFSTSGWSTSCEIDETRYLEIYFYAATHLTLETLCLQVRRAGTEFEVRTSVDGFATNHGTISLNTKEDAWISFNLTDASFPSGPGTVRIYNYHASHPSDILQVMNITLTGRPVHAKCIFWWWCGNKKV